MRFTPRRALLAAALLALLAALLLPRGAPESSPERTVRPAADPPTAALAPAVDPPELPPRRPPPKPLSNPLDKVSMGIVAAPAGGGADFVTRDRIANAFFTSQGVTFALSAPRRPAAAPRRRRPRPCAGGWRAPPR